MEGIKLTSDKSVRSIPKMIFTEDTSEPYNSGYEFIDPETRWTDVHRGPVLRVQSTSMELVLKYCRRPKSVNTEEESLGDFEDETISGVDTEFICEIPEPFSATPKSKQMRLIALTNEGTTTIRYQWLRFPPCQAMKNMLANPRFYLNFSEKSTEEEDLGLDGNIATTAPGYGNGLLSKPRMGRNPTVSEAEYSRSSSPVSLSYQEDSCDQLSNSQSNTSVNFERAKEIIGRKPPYLRDSSFDFHFREMPGILLQGQKVEMPILYRPRKAGYCHENLYLLTHPRLTDESGKTYMMRMTGICMEPDCSAKDHETGKERTDPESVKRAVDKTMLELEGADLIDSILDHALYMKQKPNSSTLPYGKLTPECIFYAHNPKLYYHYGVSERALKTVRKVVRVLIPKQRMDVEKDKICSLSITDLYSLVWSKPNSDDFFTSRFKTTKTEKLLRRLTKCSRILARPPIFAYTNAGARKHTACHANMITVMDVILETMDSIKETFLTSPLYRIQRGQLEENLRRRKLKVYKRTLKKEKALGGECSFMDKEKEQNVVVLHDETGEFETATTEYDTDMMAVSPSVVALTNPPTGEGTKDVGANGLPVDKQGTPTEEEIEHTTGSVPGAEMESPDVPVAAITNPGPEETQIGEENEAAEIPTDNEEQNADGKENTGEEVTGKKSNLANIRKVSTDSEKELVKPKKGKKDKSKIERKDSNKKSKGKKEKKQKGSIQEDKESKAVSQGPEAEVNLEEEHEIESTSRINSPESLEEEVPVVPKTTEEIIYGDIEGEVEEMLRKRTERKIRQARLIAFESMLGSGIERMLSIVDTMKSFPDYKSSTYYPGDKHSCQQQGSYF